MLIEQTLLFSEPFEFQDILPWVVVALAVIMLAGILAKCISIYRRLKRNRRYVKRDGEIVPLLTIRGEFFVLALDVEYKVGGEGQLKAGKYFLRGDGYDNFKILLNGEEQELNNDETVEVADGDWIAALSCDVLIKPVE